MSTEEDIARQAAGVEEKEGDDAAQTASTAVAEDVGELTYVDDNDSERGFYVGTVQDFVLRERKMLSRR